MEILTKQQEQEHIFELIVQTHKLLDNQNISSAQKLERLTKGIQFHQTRVEQLKAICAASTYPSQQILLERYIEVREKAASYLKAAAKWLIDSEGLLHERPRCCHAVP